MSDFNPWEFHIEPDEELDYLRRLFRVFEDCDAINDLLDGLSGNDIDTYAELDHVRDGLLDYYQRFPLPPETNEGSTP